MNNPKVSIIIPVYKVETSIEQCARSIFEQTFSDIEYVFVDDCTPDKSVEVLKKVITEYPERKNQIKILRNNTNKGISFTRNTGLDNATGTYIIHVDSDDWVEPNMIKELYNIAIKNDSDLVWSDFYVNFQNNSISQINRKQDQPTNSIDCINAILSGKMHGATWNKLLKREICIVNNIRFPVGVNMCEDFYFIIMYLLKVERVSYIPNAFYHYVQNDSSITIAVNRNTFLSQMEVVQLLEKQIPLNIYGESLLLYKSRIKSSVFISGLFSNKEFINCFPELNSNTIRFTGGGLDKMAVKMALNESFFIARVIVRLSHVVTKLLQFSKKIR